MNRLSNIQLPPPLMTSEVGSFARKTIVERKPQIIQRVIADHQYPFDIVNDLEKFTLEIATQPIALLREDAGDYRLWHAHWSRFAGKTWLEVPWYFAETYFYRRLLEITRYDQPGPYYAQDPFLPQKINQEMSACDQLAIIDAHFQEMPMQTLFTYLLHAVLWGNRADLSNFTVNEIAQQGVETQQLRKLILIDHTVDVYHFLRDKATAVAFINDNVGADSLNDLLLADFLLTHEWVQKVEFHLKHRPFFVSDAMPVDIERVVGKLSSSPGIQQSLGKRLVGWLQSGRLRLKTDPFWVSPLTFYHLPDRITEELSHVDLVILKGDVNYRRLLDDRHWEPTIPVETITQNFPKPFLVVRTLKGEIIAGLAQGQAEAIAAEDPTWLINGKRGIIQLVTS